ncbi:MAG: hypothetical protein ACPIE8_01535, partial [Henriciella sp.]
KLREGVKAVQKETTSVSKLLTRQLAAESRVVTEVSTASDLQSLAFWQRVVSARHAASPTIAPLPPNNARRVKFDMMSSCNFLILHPKTYEN